MLLLGILLLSAVVFVSCVNDSNSSEKPGLNPEKTTIIAFQSDNYGEVAPCG